MLRAVVLLSPFLGGCLVLSAEAFRETDDAPLPIRRFAESDEAKPTSPELTQGAIMEEVLAHKRQLAECIAQESRRYGLPHGKLLLVWDILPSGSVANIGVAPAEYERRAIAHCIAGVVATFHFPPSADGGGPIMFPFKF
jgi:hypothetical protein